MTATEGMTDDYDAHSEYQRAVADAGAARIRSRGRRDLDPRGRVVRARRLRVLDRRQLGVGSEHRDRRGDGASRRGRRSSRCTTTSRPTTGTRSSANVARDDARPSVLHLASGASFFGPTAPAGSVHLGMSFSAAHWLREQPTVVVPEGFYSCEATGDARTALAAQADAGLDHLPPGPRRRPRVRWTAPGADGRHRRAGATSPPASCCGRWPRSPTGMAEDGLVGHDAVRVYLLPVYARTVVEARAPRRARRRAVHRGRVPHRHGGEPVLHHVAGRRRRGRLRHCVRRVRRAGSPSPACASTSSPGSTTPTAALDEFFTRLTTRFRADPERDRFDDWTLTVVLARN